MGKLVPTIPQQAHKKIHLGRRIRSNSEPQQEGAKKIITLKPHISAEEGAKTQRGEDTSRITQPISDREWKLSSLLPSYNSGSSSGC